MTKRHIFTTIIGAMITLQAGAQLVINELMQSNIDCIMDDLNEFPDSWVELYNTGSTAVNLNTYKIGLTDNVSEAWQLPSQTVGPNQYMLVYCDKEGSKLHTDFRLESGKGGSVYLFNNGVVIDKVEKLKKQPAPNIAYGRKDDGSDEWGYQLSPTPKTKNSGQICDGGHILGEPVFSEKGKVVTGSMNISLTLSLPEGTPEGATIRYTMDGSEPTMSSAPYMTPITITKTHVIRAKIFCEGWLSPRSTTHTYILHPREVTLPVIAISTNSKYLNDPMIGIYVDGAYKSGKKNYEYDWRRPIHFEYFEGENTPSSLNQLCETRIMGGATRGNKFKSLAVYANKRFGTKRLEYEFFPDQKPGLTDFKSIALRNAGNDFDYLYMRDAIIQRTMAQHVDLDWQAWSPAIIYINGEYKGMLNIRERSNEDNIYTNYDGLEDIDMIENWNELKEGDKNNWNQFKNFYAEHNHTLKEYEQWVDWEEFFNLMIMNLYYNNQDFPGNNIVMWRPRTADGRWRFVAKDTDFGMGLYGSTAKYKTIEWLYTPGYDSNRDWGNQYEYTRLFRRMLEDPDLNREFLDRCAIYMGDFLNEKGTREVWDPMYEMISYEYPYHRKLINEWWPNYNDELNSARNWLSKRTDEFYKQLGDYYKLGNPIPATVNTQLSEEEQQSVQYLINGIPLSKGVFNGKLFGNRRISLEGVETDNWGVTGWTVKWVSSNGVLTTVNPSGSTYSFTIPSCQQLIINAVLGDPSGITQVDAQKWHWQIQHQQLVLTDVPAQTTVMLYNLQGILLNKVKADGSTISLPLENNHQTYLLKVGDKTVKISK
ncbi:MAG: CotH kinase family protein [Prevotella sp.]|nr:CotH kinase family protein [Prevotella sp.]